MNRKKNLPRLPDLYGPLLSYKSINVSELKGLSLFAVFLLLVLLGTRTHYTEGGGSWTHNVLVTQDSHRKACTSNTSLHFEPKLPGHREPLKAVAVRFLLLVWNLWHWALLHAVLALTIDREAKCCSFPYFLWRLLLRCWERKLSLYLTTLHVPLLP